MLFYLLPLLLALLPQSSYQIGFVTPITPFGATFVNTKLPSIYNLHFSLSSGLRNDAYIKVKFANYTTLGTPTCLYGVNLASGMPTATQACSVVSDSVYLAPGATLLPTDEIYLTIFLTVTIPDTPGYTELFEVSTVSSTDSSTAVIFDTNPGFGNFLWGANSDVGTLFMEGLDFGTDATRNLQGASNDVQMHIRFNRGFTAELSRILVVVDMPWKFDSATTTITVAKSPLYDVAVANNEPTDLYDVPDINQTVIINNQVIEVYFQGAFPEGREFLMTVTNVVNPIAIASGKLRFYSTDYTSNSVLEANENTVIYTSDNTIDLKVSLAAGMDLSLAGPVKLYKNTEQYLKLAFDVGLTTIPKGTTLKYQFSTGNTPIPGTLFIYQTLTPLTSDTKVQYTYGTDSITLTNLGQLTAGDTIFIQSKVLFSKIQPQLKVTISIIVDGIVVKYGESEIYPLNTNAKSAITSIVGQGGIADVFDINSPTSIRFNFYSDTRATTSNSKITIYTSAFITAGSATCTASSGVTFATCTLATTTGAATGTYTTITMQSPSASNALTPGATVTVTIGGLTIAKPSSHEEAIYEFYVRVDKDGSGTTAIQDAMVYAFVRAQRNGLTNLNQYHSLDVNTNTLAQFPSFMRVYGTNTALSAITTGSNTNAVLTIYGYNTLADFLAVTNEGAFPCGASIAITCVYIKGNPNKLATNPIDWDRVVITLDSSVTSTAFNLYIPQFFKDTSAQVYEFIVGTYDTTTRIYQNTYIENQYSTTPTRTPTSFTVTTSGLITNTANLYIDLRGQRAGVTVSSPITLSLETQGGYTYNTGGANNGASAVVVTEWDLWNSQALVNSISTPLSTQGYDATVYMRYTTTSGDNQNAVLFPMIGAANPQKTFLIDKVEMPYSLDIPNYVMYITDSNGALTYWNSLINSGRNALINSAITDFNFNCQHMIQGYLNTYCTLTFTTNAKIDRQAKIRIAYSNAFISIAQCSLTYLTAPSTWSTPVSSSDYTCTSALQQIELSFDMEDRLPVTTYKLVFYGFDQGSGSSQNLVFSIYDANYGFVVEQTSYNYTLELAIPDVISIATINYDFLNLDAISNFRLQFSLPRDIYPNEILEFDIGADLQSNNKNTDRLAIVLLNVNTNTRVEIYGTLKSQILTMQFGSGVQLAAGTYQISILNMKTPTTHSTDKVKIRLRRSTDSVFVMQSKEASYTSYPVLQLGASSFVKIVQSRFLCVACLGEFTFQVTLTNSYIDPNSTVYVHFPSYFLPAITNQAEKLDCRFGLDPVGCSTDPDYPYRLKITGSPIYLNPGDTFNITVYGFIVPNIVTVEEAQEDIFFAVDSWFNGTFSEQSNVQLPSMTNIKSDMGAVFFYELTVARTVVRDKVDHVLRANITAAIPTNSTFSVTFTNEYSNIRYLETLPCNINVYINGVKNYYYSGVNCTIVGQSVKFNITKDIAKDYSLEITIQNVPTPPKLATVDPNEFILAAFGVDENDVLAISRETLNSIYYLNFVDAINTIEAQSNADIVLTRGTYSDDIFIGTNGGKRTIQDVSITASAEGFTFVPAIIDFFVGDISHTFKVGCDQNVKLRTYPFNFTQTQDEALVNAYGDLFNVRVDVVDTPVTITIPTTIIVPKGGSSLPIAVQLLQKPFKDMQILIDVDEDYYNGAFGVDLDYSAPSLNFTSTDGLKYISFYSTDAISSFPSTFTVNLKLDGSNYKSYTLSTSQITIQIQTVAFGTASIAATQGTIQKTQVDFSITPASEGMLIVQLSQDCVAKRTLSAIKNILRNNSYVSTEITNTGCPQTYLTRVMSTPGTPITLNLPDLTPETKYNVYMYFENKAKQSNSASPASFSFTTQRKIFSLIYC